MILSATLSKPTTLVENKLGKPYEKIKISIENSAKGTSYFAQMFTKTQVFHQHFSEDDIQKFLSDNRGITFKNCVIRTESEEITYLTNKKGKVTEIRKEIRVTQGISNQVRNDKGGFHNDAKIIRYESGIPQKKNYLLQEGISVPFLVLLGVMTSDGKVVNSRYDKFRQINRFLEFVDDVLPEVTKNRDITKNPIRIADFGCGKSYLTFAVHYFLTDIKNLPCEIEGLDLKENVIRYCNDMAQKLQLKGLVFHTGNISDYSGKSAPDIVITLHACDTATDFALRYAVEKNAKVILSVPCCQHQINQQLGKNKSSNNDDKKSIPPEFEPLLKWGIIREKFSSLVTDSLRGEWLESQGYNVQMLEFIDEEHTPKNILIRAVKKEKFSAKANDKPKLMECLKIHPEIWK